MRNALQWYPCILTAAILCRLAMLRMLSMLCTLAILFNLAMLCMLVMYR